MKQTKTATVSTQKPVIQRPIASAVLKTFSVLKETIIWTALPNGRAGSKLMLSAHVSFQLAGPTEYLTLNSFKNAANWDLSGLKVYVKIGDLPEKLATIVSAPKYDKTLWKKFFQETSPVKSWGYVPKKNPPIETYHAQGVGAYLTTVQANQAMDGFYRAPTTEEQVKNPLIKQAAIDTPPAVPPTTSGPIRGAIGGVRPIAGTSFQQSHAAVLNQKASHPSVVAARNARQTGAIPSATEHQIAEAHQYLQASASRVTSKIPKPAAPKMDFHQAMTSLGQHPALMRIIGVVLDLEVDLAAASPKGGFARGVAIDASRTKLPAAVTVGVTLRVEGLPHPEAADIHYPQTVSLLSSTNFIAAPRPYGKVSGDIVDGFLDMNPSKVQVGTLDLHGGVTKMIMYAEGIVRRSQYLSVMVPKTMAASAAAPQGAAAASPDELYPSHRTSGISIYRVNRLALVQAVSAVSDQLHEDLTKAQSGAPGAMPIQLYSDDLFKGWRPDVEHKNKWYSLTSRNNSYQIGEKSLDTTDEGQTASSETKDTTDGPSKLPESLFTWNGWSLVARRPGQPLGDDGQLLTNVPQTKADFTTWAKTPGNLDRNFPMGSFAKPVPGSLPELRFGESYSMRARSVDLAGNSHPLSADHRDAGTTTHQSTLYLRQEPITSPTMFQTSPNTLRGDSAAVLAIRKYLGKPTTETATRVMVVPEGGENFAELHGKLDDANGHVDPAKYAVIASVDARAKASGPLPNIISGDVPPLPYLPDPAALGATVRSGTGFVLPILKAGFYNSDHQWPNPMAGKIMLSAAAGAATTAGLNGTTFSYGLLPGQSIDLLLSSNTSHAWLPEFNQSWAIEHLLMERNKSFVSTIQLKAPMAATKAAALQTHAAFGIQPKVSMFKMPADLLALQAARKPIINIDEPSAVAQGFVDGLNYALTPYRNVKIVHATQVPEPGFDIQRFAASRAPGKTYAGLAFAGDVHTWSTGELEFMSTHTDPVDDLSEPQRKTKSVTKTSRAFTLAVPYNDPKAIVLMQDIGTHEFHDTKAHLVDYVVVAKTRYQEYFPSDWPKTNDPTTAFSISYPVSMNSGKFGIQAEVRAVPGAAGARPAANPNGIYIPSSQRPDSLPLEYIVPVFLWGKANNQGQQVSAKKGNMLRIFLRRPWFSTGIDEKLGVILGGPFNDGDPNEERVERWTTRIGADPVFANPPFIGAPTAANFPGHEATHTVGLAELNGRNVEVLSYSPIFDDVRQMWYVDIEVKSQGKTYNPFVRLAMARFQPHSLPGLGIGPVVVADIMQLQADRMAILTVTEPKKQVVVSMAGIVGETIGAHELVGAKNAPSKNTVIASLERKTGPDPDTGWAPEYDAKGAPIQVNVPFLDESLAGVIPSYIEGPQPFVKSRFAAKVVPENVSAISTLKSQLVVASKGERAGTINLPDPNATYRIVLREYEHHGWFEIDVRVTGDKNGGEKLVHVDVMPIPAS